MVSFTTSAVAVLTVVLAASSASASGSTSRGRYIGCIKGNAVGEYASEGKPEHAASLDACRSHCDGQIAMFTASSLTCSCADPATTFLPSDHISKARGRACDGDHAIVLSPISAPLRVQQKQQQQQHHQKRLFGHESSPKQRESGHLCPKGQHACNNLETKSFDCVDTQTSLTSCGGCAFGEFDGNGLDDSVADRQDPLLPMLGTDCTSVVGVEPSQTVCHAGQCYAKACSPGWLLWDGECV